MAHVAGLMFDMCYVLDVLDLQDTGQRTCMCISKRQTSAAQAPETEISPRFFASLRRYLRAAARPRQRLYRIVTGEAGGRRLNFESSSAWLSLGLPLASPAIGPVGL